MKSDFQKTKTFQGLIYPKIRFLGQKVYRKYQKDDYKGHY